MDMQKLTEENLKKVLVNAYSQAVALRQDCEEGFRALDPDAIRVFIRENETTVEFPCLHAASAAFACAIHATAETCKLVFGTTMSNENDGGAVVGDAWFDQQLFRPVPGIFVWRHRR